MHETVVINHVFVTECLCEDEVYTHSMFTQHHNRWDRLNLIKVQKQEELFFWSWDVWGVLFVCLFLFCSSLKKKSTEISAFFSKAEAAENAISFQRNRTVWNRMSV